MARWICLIASFVSLVSALLATFVDPKTMGVDSEPGRIAFLGGFGLLAGVAGAVALIAAGFWLFGSSLRANPRLRRVFLILVYGLAIALVTALWVRRGAT